MTTTIQSGSVSHVHAIKLGDKVSIGDPPVKGRVTQMAFSRKSLRGCVQYTDSTGALHEEWETLDEMTAA